MDRREKLTEIFEDTKNFISQNKTLTEAAAKSCSSTKLYETSDYPLLSGAGEEDTVTINITKSRTFEASMRLAKEYPDKKIAVLNFASATRPGGGVTTGASAQEECLCRCSTLYPTLDQNWLWRKYYRKNRDSHDVLHTDACIYSPDIIIFKTDTDFPERLPEDKWAKVDVISCAAPNLRREPANWHNPETGEAVRMDSDELYALHLQRTKHILHIAASRKVDILVLGAFGCGAFANDPNTVAKAILDAIEEYKGGFFLIEFAIYCNPYDVGNYTVFQELISKRKTM